ncbi:hypothetical protein PHEL49_0017 [Polaribacter sp. Hel1_33_49]|nr:hypothetical protein PHEL49_0017 [Polaribacter sp. Hel1_33_49]
MFKAIYNIQFFVEFYEYFSKQLFSTQTTMKYPYFHINKT